MLQMKPFINIVNDIKKKLIAQIKRSSRKNDRETIMKTFKEYENIDKVCEETIFERIEHLRAEYQGVKLNDPIRGSKKFYVYVKNEVK